MHTLFLKIISEQHVSLSSIYGNSDWHTSGLAFRMFPEWLSQIETRDIKFWHLQFTAFDISEVLGTCLYTIGISFLLSWKLLATPKVLPNRIEAVCKLYPPCISGWLWLLKLRKISQESKNSILFPVWLSFCSEELVKPGWQVPLLREWALLASKDDMSNGQCPQNCSVPYSTVIHIPLLFYPIVLVSLSHIFQPS